MACFSVWPRSAVWSSAAGWPSGGRPLGSPAPSGRDGDRALGRTAPRQPRGVKAALIFFSLVLLSGYATGQAWPKTYRSLPKEPGVHVLQFGKRSWFRERNFAVYVSPSFDFRKRRPLVVVLHNAGISGDQYIKGWADQVGNSDMIVLAPNSADSSGRWAPEDASHVLNLTAKMKSAYRISRGRVFVTGFSSGGWMAWYLGLRHGAHFRAAAPIAGWMDEMIIKDVARRSRYNVPFFVLAGTRDSQIPIGDIRSRVNAMRKAGIGVRFEEFNVDHASPSEFLILVLDWFDRFQ